MKSTPWIWEITSVAPAPVSKPYLNTMLTHSTSSITAVR